MRDSEKITLKNMVYSGYLGVTEWEREVPTRLEVDLEMHADLRKACKSDDLNDTIDYAKVYDLVDGVIKSKHHNLLESLAEEISAVVFGLRECDKVVVRIRKPHPPVDGMCDHAEVEIVRHNTNRR
ncbi:MAG: dihydroneopterin aldolase [Candidatus Hydrogenedentota bacterium]|nr:MAG: dihydroneopterin aldolase [Candidatus Hydrogenedentota bacterium]